MPSRGPAVVAADVSVRRGVHDALDFVSFTLPAGRVTGLLGPSGCGKSTLMRAIVGVQRDVRGRLEVLGLPAGSPQLRHRIGYVTQAPSVYPDLTVRENLRYFARVVGAPARDVDAALADVDLQEDAESRCDALSGGQLSRASLAVALVGRPELLVLDEPTVGLDPLLRNELWKLFRRLVDDGRTLLVSSHVMDEATRCDDLLLLREGRLLAHDTPEALLSRTGAADADAAFLRLVAGLEQAP